MGRIYYREVSKGFQQLTLATNVLKRASNDGGTVVSALSSVASRWISLKIFDWQELCPGAHVRIFGRTKNRALVPRKSIPPLPMAGGRTSTSMSRTLFTDWVVPACSPALIAHRAPQCPEDVLSFPLLNVQWETDYKSSIQWREPGEGRSPTGIFRAVLHPFQQRYRCRSQWERFCSGPAFDGSGRNRRWNACRYNRHSPAALRKLFPRLGPYRDGKAKRTRISQVDYKCGTTVRVVVESLRTLK